MPLQSSVLPTELMNGWFLWLQCNSYLRLLIFVFSTLIFVYIVYKLLLMSSLMLICCLLLQSCNSLHSSTNKCLSYLIQRRKEVLRHHKANKASPTPTPFSSGSVFVSRIQTHSSHGHKAPIIVAVVETTSYIKHDSQRIFSQALWCSLRLSVHCQKTGCGKEKSYIMQSLGLTGE